MADNKTPDDIITTEALKPGISDVINTIDNASKEELEVLSRIEKHLSKNAPGQQPAPAGGNAERQPRSVRLVQKSQQQKEQQRIERSELRSQKKQKPAGSPPAKPVASASGQPDTPAPGKQVSEDRAIARNKALEAAREAKAKIQTRRENAEQRKRDGSGRFTSKDKADELKAEHADDDQDQSDESKSILKKLGSLLSDASDPMDANGTNAAGVAAGGSFWKAGHEAYTMAKGAVTGTYGTVKKLSDFRNDEDAGQTKRPGIFRKMFSRGKNGKSSAGVIDEMAQREQRRATKEQTDEIKKGNEEIVSKLDDLIDKQVGKKKGGLAGLLGGLGALIFGKGLNSILSKGFKKIIARVLAMLGAKKLAEKIGMPGRGSQTRGGGNTPETGEHHRKNKGGRKSHRKEKAAGRTKGRKRGRFGRLLGGLGLVAGGAYAANEMLDQDDDDDYDDEDEDNVIDPASETRTKATPTAAEQSVTHAEAGATEAVTKATAKAEQGVATKAAEKGGVRAAEGIGIKTVAKTAAKTTAKVGLRAIPIIGWGIGAGMDAVEGWNDKEGQQAAFDLQDGQKASARQKTEYTAANIVDMGGLVSGASGLLSMGASKLGFDGVADKLNFSTEDIAKGIDNKVTAAQAGATKLFSSASDFFGFNHKEKKQTHEQEGNADKRNQSLIDAIKEGAKKTKDAVDKVTLSLVDKAKNTVGGVKNAIVSSAQTVKDYGSLTYARITQPNTDEISSDLNIGGRNARNRNFRNNNFGNLVYVGQKGARLENANAKGERRFARFATPEEGFRALGNQLMSYSDGTSKAAGYKKLQSINQILPLYAPRSENNTGAYMQSLSQQLGVGINDKLNLEDPAVMAKVMRSISVVEGGNPNVTDQFITNSLGQYQRDGKSGRWVGEFNDVTLSHINSKRQAMGLAPVVKNAQASGLATVDGKPVSTETPLAELPVATNEPEQHAQAAKAAAGGELPVEPTEGQKAANDAEQGFKESVGEGFFNRQDAAKTSASGAVQFRQAELPTDKLDKTTFIGGVVSKGVEMLGADKVRNAEGLRHQVTGKTLPGNVQQTIPESQEQQNSASRRADATQFTKAELPTDKLDTNTFTGSLISKGVNMLGGEKVRTAEGLRHQVTGKTLTPNNVQGGPTSPQPALSKPSMVIPSKMPTVQDMAGSHMQPTVKVTGDTSFPKEVMAMFKAMRASLGKIEENTKDTAQKTGDKTPKANTPQPGPRESVPTSVNDPLITSVAAD